MHSQHPPKNLYKQNNWKALEVNKKKNREQFAKMPTTTLCDCCQTWYAKWKVQYRGDSEQWKFCIKCYKQHPVSPDGNEKSELYKTDLDPEDQNFPVRCSNIERLN